MRSRRILAAVVALTLVGPVAALPATSSAAGVEINTEMVVWLVDGADPQMVATDNDVVLLDALVGSYGVYLYGTDEVLDEGKIKKRFDDDERVRFAEPNYEGESADGDRYHAWQAPPQPHLTSNERVNVRGGAVDLSGAHDQVTGAGVTVAILDTGIDDAHPQLAGRVSGGWDLVDDDGDPFDEAPGRDDDGDGLYDEGWGHGTHVAGIIAQVAPAADLMAYRVLDSEGHGHVYAVAAAIFDATDQGADVINLSFGIDHKSRSKVLKEALKYAKKAGVVVVAAAGNDADDEKQYPAAEKDVLSVGALDTVSDSLAPFANHGDWVEVAAPGVSVASTLPGGAYGRWSGSSMAAPFVAGQAALLVEFAPNVKPKKILESIRKSSRKLGAGPKLKHGAVDILASLLEID